MIAKTINTLLTGGSSLVTLVGTKIFPYVMNENTELPAIVYTVDSLSPEYTKGGWSGDYIQFSVHSFSKSYTELQNVVDAVLYSHPRKRGLKMRQEFFITNKRTT
jgi:hypothetical protein